MTKFQKKTKLIYSICSYYTFNKEHDTTAWYI